MKTRSVNSGFWFWHKGCVKAMTFCNRTDSKFGSHQLICRPKCCSRTEIQFVLDLGENARRDMVLTLEEMGIDVESSFHEVAAGQHELDFCPAAALRTADQLMTAKFAIRTIPQMCFISPPIK